MQIESQTDPRAHNPFITVADVNGRLHLMADDTPWARIYAFWYYPHWIITVDRIGRMHLLYPPKRRMTI